VAEPARGGEGWEVLVAGVTICCEGIEGGLVSAHCWGGKQEVLLREVGGEYGT
jgi:hypothetical protein